MRIDAYNQLAQIYSATATKSTTATGKAKSTARDEVQISSTGKDIQTAKAGVTAATGVREELVAVMKEKIKSGSYSVDTEDFAEKLLSVQGVLF